MHISSSWIAQATHQLVTEGDAFGVAVMGSYCKKGEIERVREGK